VSTALELRAGIRESLLRRNGEPVFHHDWERRAFAIAVALCEQGCFDWDEFRSHLIDAIATSGETAEQPDPQAPGYYEHWLGSLERTLAAKGLI
jgi:nitrile hydratase accessory protein